MRSRMGRSSTISLWSTSSRWSVSSTSTASTSEIVINVIREYEVVEKKYVTLPDDIRGLVRCPNPKCITNNEPMKSAFRLLDRDQEIMQCEYCTRKVHRGEIILCDE